MTHIMLDLETFGTKPGSVIRSVGAAAFSPFGEDVTATFYANISEESAVAAGLTKDPRTVAWWAEQDAEAQAALLDNQRDIIETMAAFAVWFLEVGGEQVWAQGATFDPVLWEAAAAAVNIRVPWKFWNVRDTRTIYEVSSLITSDIPRNGTYHNALDDAVYQVACVQAAYRNLGVSQ